MYYCKDCDAHFKRPITEHIASDYDWLSGVVSLSVCPICGSDWVYRIDLDLDDEGTVYKE